MRNAALDRRAAGHDRRAARLPPAAGRGPGRRAPPDRAQPARRRPAAADRAHHPAQPAGGIRRRPGPHQAGHPRPQGELRAALDDLRALARGIYPPLLAEQGLVMALRAQARPQPAAGRDRGGPGRPLPAGRRGHRLLLHSGGAAERRQVRAGLAATVRLSGSDDILEFSVTDDGAGFRPPPPGTAPACRACPTGWPRSAAPWPSAPGPARAPP